MKKVESYTTDDLIRLYENPEVATAKNKLILAESKISKIRTANQCIEDGRNLPALTRLFGNLLAKGQLVICFADTKVGKSILAVALADRVSRGMEFLNLKNETCSQKVLYYDFELSDRQFKERYEGHIFSDYFLRVTINSDNNGDIFQIEYIEEDIIHSKADLLVIENITWLSMNNLADGEIALRCMRELDRLKKLYNLTILVLAHTPKLPIGQPLHINHLAGSKQLQNFCDGIFAVGLSSENKDHRYIKHLISRDFDTLDEVIVCRKAKIDGMLTFEFITFDKECIHLPSQTNYNTHHKTEKQNNIERAKQLYESGLTYEEIGKEIGVTKSAISKWFKKDNVQ